LHLEKYVNEVKESRIPKTIELGEKAKQFVDIRNGKFLVLFQGQKEQLSRKVIEISLDQTVS
jgi:hypothetical protein